jgi:hypothetical protein
MTFSKKKINGKNFLQACYHATNKQHANNPALLPNVPNLKRQQGYRKNKSFHNWLKRHTWHISKKN